MIITLIIISILFSIAYLLVAFFFYGLMVGLVQAGGKKISKKDHLIAVTFSLFWPITLIFANR